MTKLWDLFKRRRPNYAMLTAMLDSVDGRETLLGVKRQVPPAAETVAKDATDVIAHSLSRGYGIWAKEAWSDVISAIDSLTRPGLTDREVDFYRGCLRQTMRLLQISYQAQLQREWEASKNEAAIKSSARRS